MKHQRLLSIDTPMPQALENESWNNSPMQSLKWNLSFYYADSVTARPTDFLQKRILF
jgi:hypothetical protein